MRILVIDDYLNVEMALRGILDGHTVAGVRDPAALPRMLPYEEPFEAAIVDLRYVQSTATGLTALATLRWAVRYAGRHLGFRVVRAPGYLLGLAWWMLRGATQAIGAAFGCRSPSAEPAECGTTAPAAKKRFEEIAEPSSAEFEFNSATAIAAPLIKSAAGLLLRSDRASSGFTLRPSRPGPRRGWLRSPQQPRARTSSRSASRSKPSCWRRSAAWRSRSPSACGARSNARSILAQ